MSNGAIVLIIFLIFIILSDDKIPCIFRTCDEDGNEIVDEEDKELNEQD